MSSQVSVIPKGLHHLEVLTKNKFQNKWPSRLPHGPTQFVPSANRIRRWNITPGDRVRLLVGKKEDKYLNAEQGADAGWKVYTVKTVDMERNRIYINDYSNKKSATTRPRPDNFASMSAEEQRTWESSNNVMPSSRPVHYSNVELCVEENGPDSVFARRIVTSTPYFNKGKRRLEWDRYAAKLVGGPCRLAPDADRGLVRLDWPVKDVDKAPEASSLDLAEPITSTLSIPAPSSLSAYPIPASPTARMADQSISDAYLSSSASTSTVPNSAAGAAASASASIDADALMPLHLSEELSPRFSRAKLTAGYNARRSARASAVDLHAASAVRAWEASGRDSGLLSDSAVISALGGLELGSGLEGEGEGKVRNRTREEVRSAAKAEAREMDRRIAADVREAVKRGLRFDEGAQEWVALGKGEKTERKQRRKALKGDKERRRMEGLKLGRERNSVVPEHVRA